MLSAGCLQLMPVSQSFPGPRSVKLGPAAVVQIVTLMRTPREVGHAVRRDQQVAGNRTSIVTHQYGDKEPGNGLYDNARDLGYRVNEPYGLWAQQVQYIFKAHGNPIDAVKGMKAILICRR